MAQLAPPAGAQQEAKIAAQAGAIRRASRALRPSGQGTQVYMYSTVGSLLPQYRLTDWFRARPELMLHDDRGRLVISQYQMMGRPVAASWVDYAQPAAAQGWVTGLFSWVANRSVDGVALDANPFDDEWINATGGSPGVLANVSDPARRELFLAGLNSSEWQLGQRIQAVGGLLIANGLHKPGDNGMLFEEWCDEHSYLRRRAGCLGGRGPIQCDMLTLQAFTEDSSRLALVHIPDSGGPAGMGQSGVLKLAAFLWAAGDRSFFADVPPLKAEKAHWQCDEWAAMPRYREYTAPLGRPVGPGRVASDGSWRREFASGASVRLMFPDSGKPSGCIVWGDGAESGVC